MYGDIYYVFGTIYVPIHHVSTIFLRKTAGQQPGSGHLLFKVFPFGAIELIISKPGINDKFKTAYEILMTVVNLLVGFELKFPCHNLKNAAEMRPELKALAKICFICSFR